MTPPAHATDEGLQLPPDIMELGDNRQLNTALIQQLDHAASRLHAWIASGEKKGGADVRRHVKGFLIGMNVYPRLPLGFRLQALDELAPASKTGDAKIMLAMLATYQHALTQLPGEKYARFRIQIIAHAVNQAIRFYRHCLLGYKVLDVNVINRVLHLSRTGIDTLATAACEAETQLLKDAICRHELIRKIDFFGQTRHVQEQLWQDVHTLTEGLEVYCFDAREKLPALAGTTFLVSNLNRPASPPTVVSRLPEDFSHPAWVIPIQPLLKKARQIRQQYKLLLDRDNQQLYQVEGAQTRDQATALASVQCILDSLGLPRRHGTRQVLAAPQIWLEWNASDAIAAWQSDIRPQHRQAVLWSITDIHEGGMGLECVSEDTVTGDVGALVGIRWSADSSYPSLGFLRWRRSETDGKYRLGIEFFRLGATARKCITAGGNPMRRVIPVLIPSNPENTAIFPVSRLQTGIHFVLLDTDGRAPIRIDEILKAGPNYTVCKISKSDSEVNST